MSKRVYELFLFDIYIAILKIQKVASSYSSAEELLHEFVSWDSVIREFEIIGEATNTLIKNDILDEENQIIVDFRNMLIHHYFGIDSQEVWDVIFNDLQIYKDLIKSKVIIIDASLKLELIDSLIIENKHLDFITNELKDLK